MATKNRSSVNRIDKKYEDFLKSLQLIALGLIRSSSELDLEAYLQAPRGKGRNIGNTISTNYQLERLEKEFFESSAKLRLVMEDKKNNVKLLQIECVFLGHFHGKSLLEDGLAERFTDSEFRLVVLPYFRQFVHDLSARMSIPPILIPLCMDQ